MGDGSENYRVALQLEISISGMLSAETGRLVARLLKVITNMMMMEIFLSGLLGLTGQCCGHSVWTIKIDRAIH